VNPTLCVSKTTEKRFSSHLVCRENELVAIFIRLGVYLGVDTGNTMANEISGPLGIWPFPVLNALVQMSGSGGGSGDDNFNVKSYNVIRDEHGRVETVEILEGIGEDGR